MRNADQRFGEFDSSSCTFTYYDKDDPSTRKEKGRFQVSGISQAEDTSSVSDCFLLERADGASGCVLCASLQLSGDTLPDKLHSLGKGSMLCAARKTGAALSGGGETR